MVIIWPVMTKLWHHSVELNLLWIKTSSWISSSLTSVTFRMMDLSVTLRISSISSSVKLYLQKRQTTNAIIIKYYYLTHRTNSLSKIFSLTCFLIWNYWRTKTFTSIYQLFINCSMHYYMYTPWKHACIKNF